MTKAGVRSRWLVAVQEVHHGHLYVTQVSQEPWVLSKARSIHNCQSLPSIRKCLVTEKMVTGKKRGSSAARILGDSIAKTDELWKPRLHKEPTRYPALCITHSMGNSYFKVFSVAHHQPSFSPPACPQQCSVHSFLLGLDGTDQSQAQQHYKTTRTTGTDTTV